MKRFCLVLVILFLGLPVHGFAYGYDKNEVLPVITVEQVTAVYAEPYENAPVIAEIPAGGEFTPMEYLFDSQDSLKGGWHGVYYRENNSGRLGYIQHRDYVYNFPIRFGDVTFTFKAGYDDRSSEGQITFQAQVDDKLIVHTMPAHNAYAYPNFTVLSGYGLQNVALILKAHFTHDSCSPMTDYYVAWDGSKFLPLPSEYWSASPMEEWYVETLAFPGNGAPGNTIVKTIDTTLDLEADTSQYAVIVYKWDGEKAVPMVQDPSIINQKRNME